jgi:hypothetical protein
LTSEHEAAAAKPEAVRVAAVATEPASLVTMPDLKHIEVPIRVDNWFHPDEKPLAFRLILIVQAQLRPDFVRTEPKSQFLSAVVDVLALGTTLEPKIEDVDDHKVNFRLLGGNGERQLVENIFGPAIDFAAPILKNLTGISSRPQATSPDLNGLPNLEFFLHKIFLSFLKLPPRKGELV